MKTPTSLESHVTVIPPHRVSSRVAVEVRLSSPDATHCRWSVLHDNEVISTKYVPLRCDFPFTADRQIISEPGQLEIVVEFFDPNGLVCATYRQPYEVVDTSCHSTRQIDGCWVSLVHWSEDEARHFNTDLKKLTDRDWKEQIYAMNEVGIKSVLIQNVFDCNEYVGKHSLTVENYPGLALYPSKLYPTRYPIASEDPLEAIFQAADECEMSVFIGVGMFAWFDFCDQSLEWHKRVTAELFEMYGHHPSLYSWYISEEIYGSLYDECDHIPSERYREIVTFFKEYKAFVQQFTPTKPVALAPNNIRFQEFAKEWGEVLPHLDILIPFAFARDLENLNIAEIQAICDRAGTRFWVDMEMFGWPLDNGLLPKSYDELMAEIRIYDDVEQIFGYQFTGIMNAPDSPFNLGGDAAKTLFKEYRKRFGIPQPALR